VDKQTTKEKKTTTQILKRCATGTPQKTGKELTKKYVNPV
jgi:hypothetical protein